jgi:DNA-binding transcriptional regulator YhcF (GntR family)
VIPFRVNFHPGTSYTEQVVYAATKAMMCGQLRPGDPFPSVRTLSRELKINPNTAHKVVTSLISAGLLETRPGMGTIVSVRPSPTPKEKARLLEQEMEELTVEAKRLRLALEDVLDSITDHWKRLTPKRGSLDASEKGSRRNP